MDFQSLIMGKTNFFNILGLCVQSVFGLVLQFNGLTLQNQWDSDARARDEDLALSESNQIVQNNGMEMGWRSVFAKDPISKNLYYEVKVLNIGYNISIGLATKVKIYVVGDSKGSYGYDHNGTLWANAAEVQRNTERYFGIVGDIVGCGVNLEDLQIFFTKNGELLETARLTVDFAIELSELFPCVSLYHSGTKIKANFGPDFKYKEKAPLKMGLRNAKRSVFVVAEEAISDVSI